MENKSKRKVAYLAGFYFTLVCLVAAVVLPIYMTTKYGIVGGFLSVLAIVGIFLWATVDV